MISHYVRTYAAVDYMDYSFDMCELAHELVDELILATSCEFHHKVAIL